MTNRRGQSTVEYAVLIAVIIAALLAMQIYIKRGAMGRLRSSTDSVGEQFNPHITNAGFSESYSSTRNEQQFTSGQSKSRIVGQELQTRGVAGNGGVGFEKMVDGVGKVKGKLEDESLFWNGGNTGSNTGNR